MLSYPRRLVIDGEVYYVQAAPATKPKPRGPVSSPVAPQRAKPKPSPTQRPSHRRKPAPKQAPPPRKLPGGQFDLAKLRIPRYPEVQQAWQKFQEGKFRARGKNKDISWETLRDVDPQTAFELKRKFVDSWTKRLKQQGQLPKPKAEEPKAEEPKAEEPKAEEPKAEEPKAEEPKEEAAPLETRHKPVSTRAPAGEDKNEDIPEVAPEDVEELPDEEEPEAKPDEAKKDEAKPEEAKPEAAKGPDKELTALLKPPQSVSKDDKEVAEKRSTLEGLIQRLGLAGKLSDKVSVGPTVTSFTVEVPKGRDFNGEKLADRLEKDEDIKVIVGKQHGGKVEVQVPNAKRSTVVLRQVTDSPEFKAAPPSAIALGVDPVGKPLLLDLAKAESPHMLVTGTTGSGKSVAIQSMLASVMLRSPKDTKLVVIDPKNEFQSLDGVPHLAMPRISDDKGTIAQDATAALRKLTQEMDERVRRIGAHKDLKTYNEANPDKKMPRIVVVVDEFKDLMGESGGDFQKYVGRLLQKARSTGIHLIMGTQELTSGMLKEKTISSNLPVRIAFRAAKKQNSLNTLGEGGAEQLMGGGDGLVKIGGGEMQRFQAPYITDKGKDNEWSKLTDALRQRGTDYDPALYTEAKPEETAKPETKPEAAKPETKPEAKPKAKEDEEQDFTKHSDTELEDVIKDRTKKIKALEKERKSLQKPPDWQSDVIKNLQSCASDPKSPMCQSAKEGLDKLNKAKEEGLRRVDNELAKHRGVLQRVETEQKRREKLTQQFEKPEEKPKKHEPKKPEAGEDVFPVDEGADEDESAAWPRPRYDEDEARTAPAVPVIITRKEMRQERKDRKQREKDERRKAKDEQRKAKEPPKSITSPATPTPADRADGPLPSPSAPAPDAQATNEHLRDQGVSDAVAKHVSEMLSEEHDPQKMHQAMSKAIDKAVGSLTDPNARADVLATKGSVAHVLAKKFGAGTKRTSEVLRSLRKSAGGLWGKIWGGLKKLFGAIGKGIKWLFSRIGKAARRFGRTITGIEARHQARLNQAARHLYLRVPPHTTPVAAAVYYHGVPYLPQA